LATIRQHDTSENDQGAWAAGQSPLLSFQHGGRRERFTRERIVGSEPKGLSRPNQEAVRTDSDRDANELIVLVATRIPNASVASDLDFGPVPIRFSPCKVREPLLREEVEVGFQPRSIVLAAPKRGEVRRPKTEEVPVVIG
jgi:hypothetical protein